MVRFAPVSVSGSIDSWMDLFCGACTADSSNEMLKKSYKRLQLGKENNSTRRRQPGGENAEDSMGGSSLHCSLTRWIERTNGTDPNVGSLYKPPSKDIMRSVRVCVIEPLKSLFCEGGPPSSSLCFEAAHCSRLTTCSSPGSVRCLGSFGTSAPWGSAPWPPRIGIHAAWVCPF